MSEVLQIILTSMLTGAATWGAMRVEIAWIKRDIESRDEREAALEERVRALEIGAAKHG